MALVAALLLAGCSGPGTTSSTTKSTTKATSTSRTSSSGTTTVGTTTAPGTTTSEGTTNELSNTESGTPPPPPAPAPAKPTFACPDGPVVETFATHGSDETLPSLAWAALKTGKRFAVVWSSTAASTGTVRYSVNGGGFSTLTETVPTKAHVFVLSSLPQDGTICFEAAEGTTKAPIHAAQLSNAMFAFDEASQTYTVNMMVLADEQADLNEVRAGSDRMAQMVWDATDGWVRIGNVLVVSNDFQHHNAGYPTCAILNVPGCTQYWDVLFTNAADPAGAASTYRKGVRDDYASVWMNQYHQAMPGPLAMDDTGAVWTHELGHYLFDMADLYGDNTVITSECYDAGTGISIMAGSREATEYDDPKAPCANQPAGYTTSWELLQGEFPKVPDRPGGPVKGPSGDGDAYARFDYAAI